jgi:hypothetical protein
MYQMRRGSLPYGDLNALSLAEVENRFKIKDPVEYPFVFNSGGVGSDSIVSISAELADLLQWLLEVNVLYRCTWNDVSKHPFWLPHTPTPPSTLPPQHCFDSLIRDREKLQDLCLEAEINAEFGIDSNVIAKAAASAAPVNGSSIRVNSSDLNEKWAISSTVSQAVGRGSPVVASSSTVPVAAVPTPVKRAVHSDSTPARQKSAIQSAADKSNEDGNSSPAANGSTRAQSYGQVGENGVAAVASNGTIAPIGGTAVMSGKLKARIAATAAAAATSSGSPPPPSSATAAASAGSGARASTAPHNVQKQRVGGVPSMTQQQHLASPASPGGNLLTSGDAKQETTGVGSPPIIAASKGSGAGANPGRSVSANVSGMQEEELPFVIKSRGIGPGEMDRGLPGSDVLMQANTDQMQNLGNTEQIADVLQHLHPEMLCNHSSDVQVKPVVGNKLIEVIEKPSFRTGVLHFDAMSLSEIALLLQPALEQHLTIIYKALYKAFLVTAPNQNSSSIQFLVFTPSVIGAISDRIELLGYLYSISSNAEVSVAFCVVSSGLRSECYQLPGLNSLYWFLSVCCL